MQVAYITERFEYLSGKSEVILFFDALHFFFTDNESYYTAVLYVRRASSAKSS